MEKNRKLSFEELLNKMEQTRADVCGKILDDFREEIEKLPGSRVKHQDWPGGYKDHVLETMNIAAILYETMNNKRKLEFTFSEALFILFIHDLDKIFRYAKDKFVVEDPHLFLIEFMKNKYGVEFSNKELNAIKYIHGENKDYHPTKRIMLPLTAFVHCCDIISARIWFSEGRNKNWNEN